MHTYINICAEDEDEIFKSDRDVHIRMSIKKLLRINETAITIRNN